MTKYERILRHAHFRPVDRIPVLGGWMNGAAHLQRLAGLTQEDFWKDPWTGSLQAYQRLDVDGLLGHIVPRSQDSIRQGQILESERAANHSAEEIVAFAESRPSDDEILARFDAAAYFKEQRANMESAQQKYGDIVWMPARWDCSASFGWYGTFGYGPFFESIALYPEAWERIFRASAVAARARNMVLAKVYKNVNVPPLILTGDDICDSRGPMVSPAFLKEYYWKWEKYALEPLVAAGIKMICHCDGNVMPLMDEIVGCGFAGFHGFQEELGPHIAEIAKLRMANKERPLFFSGMSVSRTLPFGKEQDVRDDIEYAIDSTNGGKGLFLFPANVINPEVPIENIYAAYDHARAYSSNYDTPRERRKTRWPWGVKTGELVYV